MKNVPSFVHDSGHLTPVGIFHCEVLELKRVLLMQHPHRAIIVCPVLI
jgi:hypothetical protein